MWASITLRNVFHGVISLQSVQPYTMAPTDRDDSVVPGPFAGLAWAYDSESGDPREESDETTTGSDRGFLASL
jgi:hypothetical protein